jgi:cohesin complex subunit SCC1
MTLLEARMHGRLAETIFFPPSIHPDLRAMFNPEYLRRMGPDAKRKRGGDDTTPRTTPKKARIAAPTALDDEGFGDGGFGDGGFGDTGFGDTGFGDDGGFNNLPDSTTRQRTISPSLIDDNELQQDDEQPTSVTGTMSHSTVAAAHLLQKELSNNTASTLHELTKKATPAGVKREDAVKMFFEVLVLASRDVIRVKQSKGFGEIRVQGKEGLFNVGGFAGQQQILV